MMGPRPPLWWRPIRTVGVVLAVLVTVASCGIAGDSGPQAIDEDDAPPLAESTTPPTADPSGEDTAILFFLRAEDEASTSPPVTRLQRVNRSTETAPGPAEALRLLLGGTTEDEASEDLVSAIPVDTELVRAELTGDVLEVGLSEEMSTISGSGARQAFAQIVYTATRFSDVDRVEFLIDGDGIQVPTDDAAEGLVGPRDFSSLRPR